MDTDSIATNLSLDNIYQILGNNIGNKLGQLKFEYTGLKGIYITNKTYGVLLENGKEKIKSKGVLSNSIKFKDIETMYLESKNIKATKVYSNINVEKGYVLIESKKVELNWDSYKKRIKLYDSVSNLWVNTKPIYIDNLTKSLTLFESKNIIVYKP